MIAGLVLAAGQSKRMGSPKMLLPWNDGTVLERVIAVLHAAGLAEVFAVTGGSQAAVEPIASAAGARTIFNPDYAAHEMLSSLQAGLRALPSDVGAALIALGDQPQILESTVRSVVDGYSRRQAPLIVPSYRMRRGHPWLVARELWDEILDMRSPDTPRDFLNQHAGEILYVAVDSATILQDLDTPEDYLKSHP